MGNHISLSPCFHLNWVKLDPDPVPDMWLSRSSTGKAVASQVPSDSGLTVCQSSKGCVGTRMGTTRFIYKKEEAWGKHLNGKGSMGGAPNELD